MSRTLRSMLEISRAAALFGTHRAGRVLLAGGDPLACTLTWLGTSARWTTAVAGPASTSREVANKLQAFQHFRDAAAGTALDAGPPPGAAALERLVDRALSTQPYRGLWSLEGLGFACAERWWRHRRAGRSLLEDAAPPPRAFIPLHTGMGLSFARRALHGADGDDEAAFGVRVERFVAACRWHSAPGGWPMAVEALGLVLRQLHPERLPAAERALARLGEGYTDLLWHGVGRALYFAPSQLLSSAGNGLARARLEPADDAGRRNALAGFAWATTLVNVRHPWILERLLCRHTAEIFDLPAFSHGVSSALVVWRATHGEDGVLRRFLDHRPAAKDTVWRHRVAEPASDALAAWAGTVGGRALASIFHCPAAGPRRPAGQHHEGVAPASARLGRGVDAWFGRLVDSLGPEPAG